MNENSIKNTKLLSKDDLSKLFNISQASVYRIIYSRKITFYKIGGLLRFDEKDVLKYLEDCKVKIIK